MERHLLHGGQLLRLHRGRLDVAGFHKAGRTGGEFLGHCQKVVLPLMGDALHAVFLPGRKLLHQGGLFKALPLGVFNGVGKALGAFHLGDAPAAGAVHRLHDDRVFQRRGLQLFRRMHQNAFG